MKKEIVYEIPSDAYICYVDNCTPYCFDENDEFYNTINVKTDLCIWVTTAKRTEIWGDDWDDAPYNCNAGEPYIRGENNMWLLHIKNFYTHDKDDWDDDYFIQKDGWTLLKHYDYNTKASVADINSGMYAWIFKLPENKSCNGISLGVNNTINDVIKYFYNYKIVAYKLN